MSPYDDETPGEQMDRRQSLMSTERHALPVHVDAAELGTLLRRLRRERRLSIEALAFAADMHRTYLPEIERGLRNPSLGKLSDLALALGVPLSMVILEAERRTRVARIAESIERAGDAA
ncbi:MAG TPA: helix-turn-helix transcriptional regulator [Solirubrobacteraceae bacterium]|nr:helix-turn-helix transcriptional regulator [Solirubrobacteraceae bacterium]